MQVVRKMQGAILKQQVDFEHCTRIKPHNPLKVLNSVLHVPSKTLKTTKTLCSVVVLRCDYTDSYDSLILFTPFLKNIFAYFWARKLELDALNSKNHNNMSTK